MSNGYIKLARSLRTNKMWTSEPFTRGQAWVDILLSCAYSDMFVRIRGVRVDLKAGQAALSEQHLADRWKWSRGKVRRYLEELEKTEQQIVQQKTNVTTIISVVNWNTYQADGTADDTANSTANGQQTDSKRTQKRIIKNNKEGKEKDKKVTKKSKGFQKPTLEEVQGYCIERENNVDAEGFIAHYNANGWKVGRGNPMKDWKSAVITWEKNSFNKQSQGVLDW